MPPKDRRPLSVAFGAAVRKARAGRGLSQESLALRAEMNRVYLAEVETGSRNPSLENIGKIADALEVGLGDLMTITDEIRRGGADSAD